MAYDYRQCPNCIDAPAYWVRAGTSPGPNAAMRTCARKVCITDARLWIEAATGVTATVETVDPDTAEEDEVVYG